MVQPLNLPCSPHTSWMRLNLSTTTAGHWAPAKNARLTTKSEEKCTLRCLIDIDISFVFTPVEQKPFLDWLTHTCRLNVTVCVCVCICRWRMRNQHDLFPTIDEHIQWDWVRLPNQQKNMQMVVKCVCVDHLHRCKTSFCWFLLLLLAQQDFLAMYAGGGSRVQSLPPTKTLWFPWWYMAWSAMRTCISNFRQWRPAKPSTGMSFKTVSISALLSQSGLLFYFEFCCIRTFFRART